MNSTVVGVTADASVSFDVAHPDVGIKDGTIRLQGKNTAYSIPFAVHGVELPSTEQIHQAVAGALKAEGWNIEVQSVSYVRG